jgi:hypothetical protein
VGPPQRVSAYLPLLLIQAHHPDHKQQCPVPATWLSRLEKNGRYDVPFHPWMAESNAFGHYGGQFRGF